VATDGNRASDADVVIFTTPACGWCRVAKSYFAEHNIPFKEVDVTKDRRGLREMVLMTGGRAVPVIRIGEHAMTGWDVREFERLRSGRFNRR
jgi:glutaredoxin 3